ncbi:MAG TPA: HNH endonuclease signature motif containing protein [Candidatus Nitrosopolaris sp.]|nr:HNH endonuclease signature motif containing protein [Candidatus Nitrosopolaris sp.]
MIRKWTKRKSELRATIGMLLTIVSTYVWLTSHSIPHYLTTGQQKAIAISILFIALAILYRIKKENRISFPGDVKAATLRKQKYRCAFCKERLELYGRDFHHKNGDRSNNKPSNCQVLCPKCHRRNHAEELKLDIR